MVIPTSEHFKHFAIFATQQNLCNFHITKCSSLNGTRLLFHEIVKLNHKVFILIEITKKLFSEILLYIIFALYYTLVLVAGVNELR